MRRTFKRMILACLMIICSVTFLSMNVHAASASASMSGPKTVRAGDTITVTFKLKGSGIYGISGDLSYDSSQVTFKGISQKISSPWMVESNGNSIVAYDNNLTKPIDGTKEIFTATFKVKDVAPGTKITISCKATASDGSEDVSAGNASYSATIAEPLSTDNNLASLKVNNATISPAFSAAKTSYEANVSYSVEKLDISAKAADDGAQVTIDNPKLTANGTTTVKITVKAENGDTKTYKIAVKREQDPNYVASSNNNLKEIKVEGFLLSPQFSTENTEYVVWLPYETESISVSGTTADSKASVRVLGGDNLEAGEDNEVIILCKAEDGSEKVYKVVAKRAAAHGEETGDVEEPVVDEPTVDEPMDEEPDTDVDADVDNKDDGGQGSPAMTVVCSIIFLVIGIGLGIVIDKKVLSKKA